MSQLSIVIPTLNEEDCLPRLLASIERQTVQPKEVIIADAGSVDRTKEIAESFGASIVQGGLPGPGRNAGARAATGELLFFLDADVELTDNQFLEKAVSQLKARNLDVATTDILPLEQNASDEFTHKFYNRYARLWGGLYAHAPGFCILVKKALHEKIGGFDESIVYAEDYDYSRRAGREGRFGFIEGTALRVSTRRQEKDGRFVMAARCILAELHLLFLGPIRHNAFNYKFGHTKSSE